MSSITGAAFAHHLPGARAKLDTRLATFNGTKRQAFDISMLALQVAMLDYIVRTDAPSDQVDAALDRWMWDTYAIRDALGIPAG